MKTLNKYFWGLLAIFSGIQFGHSQDTTSYITVWKTDNPGTSASNQITIPGTGTNYNIYWENVSNIAINGIATGTGAKTITFPAASIYRVKINGDFTAITFDNSNDKLKLLTIEQWGDIAWSSFQEGYYGCANMDITASDTPNLAQITSFSETFRSCSSLNSPNLNLWNTTTITNMSLMFYGATTFNQPIGAWNTTNVTDMTGMFWATTFNQPIGI